MKILGFILCIFLSIVTGFLFAGIAGALGFGTLILLGILILRYGTKRWNGIKIASGILCFSVLGYVLMMACGLLNANQTVHAKVKGIEEEIINQGYQPSWFIISQKRYGFFNNLLLNSVKNGKSKHLKGKAIDLYVIDINGDGTYDKEDFKIIEMAAKKNQRDFELRKGKVFHYFGKGYFSQHMVHIEIN
jgi:hypothetical protein